MTLDGATLGGMGGFGALTLVVGHMVGAYKAKLKARGDDDARAAPILAELLKSTMNELAIARTSEATLTAQASTYGAQVESLMSWKAEQEAENERARVERAALRASNEDCEKRYASLARRLNRITPEEMPAVRESTDTRIKVTEVTNGKRG